MLLSTLQEQLKTKNDLYKEYDRSIRESGDGISEQTKRNFKKERQKLGREIDELKAQIETHPDYSPTTKFLNYGKKTF